MRENKGERCKIPRGPFIMVHPLLLEKIQKDKEK
jgi:hypothetical protein